MLILNNVHTLIMPNIFQAWQGLSCDKVSDATSSQVWPFRLLIYSVSIWQAPAQVKIGTEYQVEVTLKNPLPKKLTKCEFQLEGASLQRPVKLKHE